MDNHLINFDVIILAGGKGKRLQSVVKDRPKPMADIHGSPFLDKLISHVSSFGFDRFILCAGHMAEYLEKYYQNMNLECEIILSTETIALGTAGAVKNAEKLIQTDNFLVMNGDSFCPVNLLDFVNFHNKKNALVSVVVVEADESMDCGIISIDSNQKIASFKEKMHSSKKCYINAGIYLFNKSILNKIQQEIPSSIEEDFFPSIVGKDFYGFITNDEMLDIGTPDRYTYAKNYFS